jgi:hypothetical protein
VAAALNARAQVEKVEKHLRFQRFSIRDVDGKTSKPTWQRGSEDNATAKTIK